LKPDREIKEFFEQLKKVMTAQHEMGIDLPPLSDPALDYLDAGLWGGRQRPSSEAKPESLDSLRKLIGDCRRCRLHTGRTQLVFGEGSPNARLVFVGEGPGREEDREGRPFVGEAGRLLTRIIEAMGLKREEVYICNVVKCRPPKNRDPEKDEMETCLPFLKEQLRLIRPDVICTLGRIAVQGLLGVDAKISRDRGKWGAYLDTPLMPTYHPAFLLRNPSAKRQVWEDVQEIMKRLELEVVKHG
jgi:uracil-DNA glycosylase family 4